MWEFKDVVGLTANNRRWKCLVQLSEKLCRGEIELNELEREVEKKRKSRKAFDYESLKRNMHGGVVPSTSNDDGEITSRFEKKSNLKIRFNFNFNSVCTPPKLQVQKFSDAIPEMESESKRILDSKKRRGSEEGTMSDINISKKRSTEPVLSERVKKHIFDSGGSLQSLVLVIEKKLFQTDVSPDHQRLSIPYGKVKNLFLTSLEVDQLDSDPRGIMASLVQPSLEETDICLRNWKSNSTYVLVKNWKEVCCRNTLTQGMTIQLWCFRRGSSLCFALLRMD